MQCSTNPSTSLATHYLSSLSISSHFIAFQRYALPLLFVALYRSSSLSSSLLRSSFAVLCRAYPLLFYDLRCSAFPSHHFASPCLCYAMRCAVLLRSAFALPRPSPPFPAAPCLCVRLLYFLPNKAPFSTVAPLSYAGESPVVKPFTHCLFVFIR